MEGKEKSELETENKLTSGRSVSQKAKLANFE